MFQGNREEWMRLPPIIDADTHILEPADLWTTRLPARFRDQAPRLGEVKGTVRWIWPNGTTSLISTLNNSVNLSQVEWQVATTRGYDEPFFRKGAWDPVERLKDMDMDGVYGHLVYPSYVLFGPRVITNERELQIACTRAYNDWMSEFCSHAPERLYGLALLPMTTIEDQLDEARRVAALPGIRGVLLTMWPCGAMHPFQVPDHKQGDRLWDVLEENDLCATVHVQFGMPGEHEAPQEDMWEFLNTGAMMPTLVSEKLAVGVMPILSQFIFAGVLERHPGLRLGVAEVGAGWVPYFLEQNQDNYERHRFWTKCKLRLQPSEYWYRQCFATFQNDMYAIRNRDLVGRRNLQWSSDYTHGGSDWPHSLRFIHLQMLDVPYEDRVEMLWSNAARMLGLDPAPPKLDARSEPAAGPRRRKPAARD